MAFNFNPTAVRATNRIYEADLELIVGEPSAFKFAGKNGKSDSFGIQYPNTIAEGEFKGENYNHMLWLHSEGAAGMVKQFLMIVLGYELNDAEEERFDIEQGGKDWSFDPDTKTFGSAWHELKGHRWAAEFSKGINKDTGNPQQKISKMASVA